MAQSLRVEIIGDAAGYARSLGAASAATSDFGAKIGSIGKSTAAMGRSLTRNLTLPIVAVGIASVKMANDFSQSLTRMVGLAGVSQKQVNAWSADILKLGPEVAKSPRELAAAMYEIASSGLSTGKAMDVLTVSAKASTAGLGETKVVADAITSVMNAYGESNISAAKAGDILVATVREGKGEAAGFAPVIGNVAAVAAQLGVSFNDVGAALASMTRLGVDPTTAAVQLTAVFSTLLKGSKQTEAGLKKVGLSSAGLRQELHDKGLIAFVQTLSTAFHGNVAAMAKAFPNIRALRGLLALAGKSADSTEQIFKRMGNTTGDLAYAFDQARKKSGFKFDQLKASAEVAGIALGTILGPSLQMVATWLAKVAIAFTNLSPHMQSMITLALAVAAVTGPILIIFGSLASAVGALAPLLAAVVSPLGLIVIGVAALAGALVAAEFAPEQFATALEKIGVSAEHTQTIISTLQGVFAQLKGIFETAVADITAIWARMGPSIIASSQAIWGLISAQVQGGLNIIRGIINVFAGLFTGDWSRMWQGITQIFSGIWGNITAMFQFYLNQLIAVARGLWAALGPAFTSAFSGLSGIVSSAMSAVAGVFTRGWDAVKRGFDAVASAITGAWNTFANTMKSTALRVVLAIIEPFSHLPSKLGGWARSLKDTFNAELAKMKATASASAASTSEGFWSKIQTVATHAKAAGVGATAGIKAALAPMGGIGASAGAALSSGLAGGIDGSAAVAKAYGVVAQIRAIMNTKWESPPETFGHNVGARLIGGLAAGIIASEGLATKAAERVTQRTKAVLQARQIYAEIVAAGKIIGTTFATSIIGGLVQQQPSIVQHARSIGNALQSATPAIIAAGKVLGVAGAQAVAAGVLGYTAPLGSQIKTALAAAVATARSDFVSKFDAMASAALARFDAKVAAWKPFSQGILDKMQLKDAVTGIGTALAEATVAAQGGGADLATALANIGGPVSTAMSTALAQIAGAKTMSALATVSRTAQAAITKTIIDAAAPAAAAAQTAVDQAQAALTAAQATGDPAAIQAATDALNQAVTNQNTLNTAVKTAIETGTGLLVTAETDRHTQIAAAQRTGLATQLAELKTSLLEHPKEWGTMTAAVQKIVDAAIAKMLPAGKKLATDFAQGIRDGIGEAVSAATELANAVAAVMPVSSPAKKGPLAVDIFQAGKRWAQDFGKGIDAGGLSHTVSGMTRSNTPSTVGVGGGDAGGTTVNVYVQGALLGSSVPEVAATIRREILRTEKRNVTAFAR